MDSWRISTALIIRPDWDLSAWWDFVETFLAIRNSRRTHITHTRAHDSRPQAIIFAGKVTIPAFMLCFTVLTFYSWSTPFILTVIYSVSSYYIRPHEFYWLASNYNASSMSAVISMLLVRTQCDSQRSASLLRPYWAVFWVNSDLTPSALPASIPPTNLKDFDVVQLNSKLACIASISAISDSVLFIANLFFNNGSDENITVLIFIYWSSREHS